MNETAWWEKPLDQLNEQQWEALCDGCAKCCLHKLEDIDSGIIYYTDVACRLLDLERCSCNDYAGRLRLVNDCVVISLNNASSFGALPPSCAYRLRSEGKPLPEWHYLVSGDRQAVHMLNHSVYGRAASELDCEDDLQDRIVDWPIDA